MVGEDHRPAEGALVFRRLLLEDVAREGVAAADLALKKNVRLVTFGDMVRVPGERTSIDEARSKGAEEMDGSQLRKGLLRPSAPACHAGRALV